jgi:hypothetical protein
MTILVMNRGAINDHWDRIEAAHPWGPMELAYPEPSKYLLKAYETGLVSWDVALELYLAAIRLGWPVDGCPECDGNHDLDGCPMME